MIGYVLFGAAALLAFFWWAVRHAVGTAKVTGSPTPEEARIDTQTKAALNALDAQAEAERQKVLNANPDELADLARDKLLDEKPTTADPGAGT